MLCLKYYVLYHNKNGDNMNFLVVVFRTTFFYFFVLFSYRLMGKREVGQLGIIDLVVTILIAEMAAISIENINDSIWLTITPITILVILEILLAFISIKSRRVRSFFGGKPSLIICNGRINHKEMIKQRYSMDDLLLHLRQEKIKNIEDIEYAFLEANGKLSIFKYNLFKLSSNYPMPLIVDGQIQKKALDYIHKNENWLRREIVKKNLVIEDVFYAFYKLHPNRIYLIRKSELI